MAEFDFLQGCASKTCSPLRNGVDLQSATPFVKLKILAGKRTITVGNNSDPPFNYAAINSFKFSATNGNGGGGTIMDLVISDEAGGKFDEFYKSMVTVLDYGEKGTFGFTKKAEVTWGWMGWMDSSYDNKPVVLSSVTNHGSLHEFDVAYVNGLMKFELKIMAINEITDESTTDTIYGTDENPLHLKEAIRKLCGQYGCSVKFLKSAEPEEEWKFDLIPEGPVGPWRPSSTNLIQAITNWVAQFTTESGDGIYPMFDSSGPVINENKLILWENSFDNCNKIHRGCNNNNLGTYIVNGGKHSPVIEFSPKIGAVFAYIGESGGTTSTVKEDTEDQNGAEDCNMGDAAEKRKIGAGFPLYNVITDNAIRHYGTGQVLGKTQSALVKNVAANSFKAAVQADLKIIGDPGLGHMYLLKGKNVTIVVNNPFHYSNEGADSTTGEWLQAEPCNSYLSSKSWQIMGISHEIQEGSYTTTLGVRLPLPGSDINANLPLGGEAGGEIINIDE